MSNQGYPCECCFIFMRDCWKNDDGVRNEEVKRQNKNGNNNHDDLEDISEEEKMREIRQKINNFRAEQLKKEREERKQEQRLAQQQMDAEESKEALENRGIFEDE